MNDKLINDLCVVRDYLEEAMNAGEEHGLTPGELDDLNLAHDYIGNTIDAVVARSES